MIDKLSDHTRSILAYCRASAMQGRLDAALAILDQLPTRTSDVLEQITAATVRAELLYLDCREAESLAVFDQDVMPRLDAVPYEVQMSVQDNRNVVATRALEPRASGDFYSLVDERRLSGVRLWDEDAILAADEAVTANKHYDALPGYWQQLVKSYHNGCWRPFVWASRRMASECVRLEWFDKAAYHALGAQDNGLGEEIAESLLLKRDPALIGRTVGVLLRSAHLKRHASVAAALMARVGDAVPCEYALLVKEWLSGFCCSSSDTWQELAVYNQAWSAAKSLIPLLNPDEALDVARWAFQHRFWRTAHVHREKLIDAVSECVAVVRPNDLHQFVPPCLLLVTEAKWDHDYVDAVNLLCHIAQRGDVAVKASLANTLYPSQSPVANPILLQVAPLFEQRVGKTEELNAWAVEVSRQLLLQVQHLENDKDPVKPPGSFGQLTREGEGGRVVVYLNSSSYELSSLTTHRKVLSTEALAALVASMLRMIADDQNMLANRMSLIHTLGKLADCIDKDTAASVMDTLLSFAEGKVTDASVSPSSSAADVSLSRFRIDTGDPGETRGVALLTLAQIEQARPGVYDTHLHQLLERGFSSSESVVRRWAFLAAHRLPSLPESALAALLLGSRDPDPLAAAWAIRALLERSDLDLSDGYWHAVVYSLTLAAQSSDSTLRAASALAIAKLISKMPDDDLRAKTAVLKEQLAGDICHSVRSALGASVHE